MSNGSSGESRLAEMIGCANGSADVRVILPPVCLVGPCEKASAQRGGSRIK